MWISLLSALVHWCLLGIDACVEALIMLKSSVHVCLYVLIKFGNSMCAEVQWQFLFNGQNTSCIFIEIHSSVGHTRSHCSY
jgi:hypothetical protein